MAATSDLDVYRRLLDEVAATETRDLRADTRRVAERFLRALSAKDLALLMTELREELARRRPAIVSAAVLTAHSRRVAVLEAALEVLSDKDHDG